MFFPSISKVLGLFLTVSLVLNTFFFGVITYLKKENEKLVIINKNYEEKMKEYSNIVKELKVQLDKKDEICRKLIERRNRLNEKLDEIDNL